MSDTPLEVFCGETLYLGTLTLMCDLPPHGEYESHRAEEGGSIVSWGVEDPEARLRVHL